MLTSTGKATSMANLVSLRPVYPAVANWREAAAGVCASSVTCPKAPPSRSLPAICSLSVLMKRNCGPARQLYSLKDRLGAVMPEGGGKVPNWPAISIPPPNQRLKQAPAEPTHPFIFCLGSRTRGFVLAYE